MPGRIPEGSDATVSVLAGMLLLVPALGVPSLLVLQDTLKSALAAFGILAAALWFAWQQRHRTAPLVWHGLVWLPLALMAYALGSMVWSHTYLGGAEAIRWFLVSLFFWTLLNSLSRDNLPKLVWGIHGGLVVASLWTALQFWFDFALFPQSPQPASTFINRNFFAEYAIVALPYSAWALANARPSRWLGVLALSVALCIVAILMTGTRSALVALVATAPLLIFLLTRYRGQFACANWPRQSLALVAGVLVTGVVSFGSIPSGNAQVKQEGLGTTALQRSVVRGASMAQHTEYTTGSFSTRSTMWMATARMALANPWTGVGAGAWEVQIPLYQRVDSVQETDYYAHNEALQLLSEYGGVVGGLVLAVLLAYWLQASGHTLRLGTDGEAQVPSRGIALISLLALGIVSNAGFPLHLAACGCLLTVGLALLAHSDTQLRVSDTLRATSLAWSPVAAKTVMSLMAVALVLAIYVTVQAVRAESNLVQAIQLATPTAQSQQLNATALAERKAAALEHAHRGVAINPHYRKLTAEVAEPFAAQGDWANAIWILESVVASRPHGMALWRGLAMGYAELGNHPEAQRAFREIQRLKPDAPATFTLQAILLNRAGQPHVAANLLRSHLDAGTYDYAMLQTGYALGLEIHDWPLAIQSLQLRNETWPEQAADGYMRLGKIYADPNMNDIDRALAAFRAGRAAVPPEEVANYTRQVPEPFGAQM
jgi:O-antigen ligase/tetratricopeptide (TPR) repeat protein